MLLTVLIQTGTGSLLYEKTWSPLPSLESKKTIISALLTTLHVFSRQATSLNLSHISFGSSDVRVTIVADEKTQLRCFLFSDSAESYDFTKLVSTRILLSFCDAFPTLSTHQHGGISNLSEFSSFSGGKLLEAISSVDRDVLYELRAASVAIVMTVLVYNDSGDTVTAGSTVEEMLGLVANLRSLVTFSDEMLLGREDRTAAVRVELERHRVLVLTVGSAASLVVVCNKSRDTASCIPHIERAVSLLSRLFSFLCSVKGSAD